MLFELFLGIRYLRAKRKQTFISVITAISVIGVMVGVMALVIVLSVMNGFRADLMEKILGVNSHLIVLNHMGAFKEYLNSEKIIRNVDGVVASTPFIYGQVLINYSGNASGAILNGIDPGSAGRVTGIGQMIKRGSLKNLEDGSQGYPPLIIGQELASHIGVSVGDILTVISPEGKMTPIGRVPNTRKYKISGIFNSGMYEYDASLIFVSLKQAQEILSLGNRVTGIEVRVEDYDQSDVIAEEIKNTLGYPFWTKDWKVMNRSLFSAMELEKIVMGIILIMIVLVGALNIISTLVMVVMEKTKDIAILRAMGASQKSIMLTFMLQGVLVGVVGTTVGLIFGLGICHLLSTYEFIRLPPDVYFGITALPVRVQLFDILIIGLAAVGISFLATVYPSLYAARLNPVEAIRYE
jgi:lipoprotein-releasing system permease protein